MPQTGPTSDTGKALSARNSLRHGLYAAPDVVVNGEEPGDWAAFYEDVVADLAPEGCYETTLAQRVAISLWRLRRIPTAERMSIGDEVDRRMVEEERLRQKGRELNERFGAGTVPEPPDWPILPEVILLPPEHKLVTLMRFEAHLNRQFSAAVHELEARQARRRGEASPLARLDVTIDSESEK